MQDIMCNKFDNICRACLGEGANISLFGGTCDLSRKIMECVHIVISETDGYCTKICKKCYLELNVSFEFINKCKASDRCLRTQSKQFDLSPQDSTTIKDDPIKVECDLIENNFDENFLSEDLSEEVEENASYDKIFSSNLNIFKSKVRTDSIEFSNLEDSKKDFENILSTVVLNSSGKRDKRKKTKIKEKFYKKSKKNRKLKLYALNGEQQCTVCGLRVVSASALSIHLRTHTGEKPFKCSSCDKSFALKSTLDEHALRLHSNAEKTITCESCGKQFYKERDLVVHMRVHTKEAPYLCPYCPRRFTQHASIIKHIRTHTGERPFSCKICSKTFTSQSQVKSHATSHSDLRPHKCSTCGKSVKNKNSLLQHMKRHVGGKDFICDQCGSSFSTKGNLVVHVTTIHSEHSGICHICNKNCSNLENHLKIHTGELLFECHYCNKKFRKCNLSSHMMKHTNSGKFKCEVDKCLKTFPTKNLLEYHFLKYHLKTPQYMCKHCTKGYYRPCDLATHTRRSHGIIVSANNS